jgi:hypothetical protein
MALGYSSTGVRRMSIALAECDQCRLHVAGTQESTSAEKVEQMRKTMITVS